MAGAGSDGSCWYAKHRPWRLWASRDGVDATTWPERCQALSSGREKSRPGRAASRCLSQRLIRWPFRPKPSQDSIASELTRKTFMMSSKTNGDGMALPLEKELLVQAIELVSKTLCRFYLIAEQWSIEQRWTLLLTHIFRHWLGGKWLGALPEAAQALLSG